MVQGKGRYIDPEKLKAKLYEYKITEEEVQKACGYSDNAIPNWFRTGRIGNKGIKVLKNEFKISPEEYCLEETEELPKEAEKPEKPDVVVRKYTSHTANDKEYFSILFRGNCIRFLPAKIRLDPNIIDDRIYFVPDLVDGNRTKFERGSKTSLVLEVGKRKIPELENYIGEHDNVIFDSYRGLLFIERKVFPTEQEELDTGSMSTDDMMAMQTDMDNVADQLKIELLVRLNRQLETIIEMLK